MLTKTNKILLALLAVQLLLAAFVLVRSDDNVVLKEQPLLAGFDAAAVTKLQIYSAGKDKPVELVKRGAEWVIASHFDYPADPVKVEAALSPIAKLAAAEPVATTASRHKQLRVADAEFDRKLVVTAGGRDTTIFVGGSAGLRRNAVRIGGSEDVYGVAGVSASAFGTAAREWVKGEYYKTETADITKVVIQKGDKSVELDRTPPPAAGSAAGSGSGTGSGVVPPPPGETPWKAVVDGQPVTLAAGESLDTFAINTIVGDVATIDASPADPKRDASKPLATITIHRKGGTDVLDVLDADPEYWVKQRGSERATLVDKDRLRTVLEAARDKLVTKAAAPGSGSAAPPPPDMPGMPPGMQPF